MADTPRSITADIFATASQDRIEELYDGWAGRYDADNAAKGARLAPVAAAFTARYAPRGAGPILDAACGTGLVGEALSILGYPDLTGLDASAEMLAHARDRGLYSELVQARLPGPVDLPAAHFAAVLCMGAFGPGHAPPESLAELARLARPGAPVIFNLVAHTWEAQGFGAVLSRLEAEGVWRVAERTPPWAPFPLGEPELNSILFVCLKH